MSTCFEVDTIVLRIFTRCKMTWPVAYALLGFVLVVLATGGNTPAVGVALVLAAAVALSAANLLVKRSGIKPAEVLGFVVWSCLFAPLPLFALGYGSSGSSVFVQLPEQLGVVALASLAFQVYPTTLFGYWVWNSLMARYSAAAVAPVALLVPVFALVFAWLIFDALPSTGQTAGIGLILLGLMISSFQQRLQAVLAWRKVVLPSESR